MRSSVNVQALSAMIGGGLLLPAIVFFALSDPGSVVTGRMTYQGDPLVVFRASVPAIADFKYFNVNEHNPFIPWTERDIEGPITKGRKTWPLPGTVTTPQARTPSTTIIPKPFKPPLKYPKLNASGADAPKAIGLIGTDQQAVLLVRSAAALTPVPVPIGGRCNGWTLLAIAGGNQAVWKDASGIKHTFPIGDGNLAEAQQLAESGSGEGTEPEKKHAGNKKDKGANPDMGGKGKAPAGNKTDPGPTPPGQDPGTRPRRRRDNEQPLPPPAPDKM